MQHQTIVAIYNANIKLRLIHGRDVTGTGDRSGFLTGWLRWLFQIGRSRNFFHFFMDFRSIFAKIKCRNTLFCMIDKFYWCLWQIPQRKMLYSVYIKSKLTELHVIYHNSPVHYRTLEWNKMESWLVMVIYHTFTFISHHLY